MLYIYWDELYNLITMFEFQVIQDLHNEYDDPNK